MKQKVVAWFVIGFALMDNASCSKIIILKTTVVVQHRTQNKKSAEGYNEPEEGGELRVEFWLC